MWKILLSKKLAKVCIARTVKLIKFFRKDVYEHIFQLAAKRSLHALKNKYSTFTTQNYALHKLDSGPSTDLSCTKEDALDFYRKMTTIRRMEQTAATMYTEKLIRGFLHLYAGQEAVAVGLHTAIKPEDQVITAYRCHGWTWLMGCSNTQILCELTGKKSGVVRGKGGSMHMYNRHFYGGNGIVGGHVPVGAGIAFSCKYIGSNGVGWVIYGDGASNQGQVFESYNMAKLWNLPIVYVCENNLYGMGTSIERASANTQFYTKGDYIPGIKADGMDVLCMREVGQFAKDYAMKNGPIIIEAVTYRYFGHSMSDPGVSYRKREEINEVRQNRDPITTFKAKILQANTVTEDELKKIDDEVKVEIDKAAEIARNDVEIGVDELAYDLYSNNLSGPVRNNLVWNPMQHKNINKAINLS